MRINATNQIAGAAGEGPRARREMNARALDQGMTLPTHHMLRS